jgi:trehalose-6-phosphate synthase
MQIAPPSGSEVPEYQEIRRALAAAAGNINGRYGEFDWTRCATSIKTLIIEFLRAFSGRRESGW